MLPSSSSLSLFFFNDTATTEIYTLSLHDALPIWPIRGRKRQDRAATADRSVHTAPTAPFDCDQTGAQHRVAPVRRRSEEHTSELQSLAYLVCRLLLEKKKP